MVVKIEINVKKKDKHIGRTANLKKTIRLCYSNFPFTRTHVQLVRRQHHEQNGCKKRKKGKMKESRTNGQTDRTENLQKCVRLCLFPLVSLKRLPQLPIKG